jgi:IS605 OrfB family transposase
LIGSQQKQLAKLNNQIRDIQHKQTTKLVSTLNDRGVQTVVIGDIRDIRKSVNCDKKANPKIHQILHGPVRKTYLGVMELPVVGVMASPIGVRYSSYLQCSPVRFRSSEPDRERIPCFRHGEKVNTREMHLLW